MIRLIIVYILLAGSFYSYGQYRITGKLTDENNEPLSEVAIMLEDLEKGTLSEPDGTYELTEVPRGDHVLVFSLLGYKTIERRITVNEDFRLDIVLPENPIVFDEVIVKSTRASETTPMTYTEVEKEEIDKVNLAQDMPYLLNLEPSVTVTSDAGAGVGYTGIRIRGSDQKRINVTINGIPLNDAESHGVFWVDLPDLASSVESVQIQRGVGTSTNGSGAFGATINIQTDIVTKKPYARVDNSYGSFNTRKHSLEAGTGLINDKFAFDARLSRVYSDGYLDRAFSDLKSYFVSGGYFCESNMLKLNVFSGKEKTYQAWYGTPEARVNDDVQGMLAYIARNGLSPEDSANLMSSGRSYNFYTYENETDNYQQDHYQLIFAQDISGSLSFNTALHYTHGEGFFEQFRNNDELSFYELDPVIIGNDTISNTDLIRRRWLDNDFYGFTYSLDYRPNSDLNFNLGGAWNTYTGDHFGEIIWAQFASNSDILERYYDNVADKSDFNIYLKGNYAISSRFNLFADLQYRTVTYTAMGRDHDVSPLTGNRVQISEDHMFEFFNPKAGIFYQISNDDKLYGSFSIANREPIRTDFIDSPEGQTPKPETLRNIEVGYRRTTSDYSFNINYYLMDYKNQLVLTGELNDVGSPLRSNVPRSYRTGIELIAGINLSDILTWNVNGTFSKNKIRNFTEVIYDYGPAWDEFNTIEREYQDTDISFSPEWIAGSNIEVNPFNTFKIALRSKYVGDQYLDNTSNENRKIDSYFVNDLRLSYSFEPSFMRAIDLSLLVNNLFNEKYSSNGYTFGYMGGGNEIRENFYYPQAGINFLAGMSLKF